MARPYPTDDETIASATAAVAEIARHIDHQSKDAESVDTKATGVLTVTAAAATLAISRTFTLDDDLQRLSTLATAAALVALVASLFQALRPRAHFSYGPDPRRMVDLLDRESQKTTLLWMVDSFVLAQERNVAFLDAKQEWYQRALRCAVGVVIGVGWMVHTGAIR